jgi:hypothetical protein
MENAPDKQTGFQNAKDRAKQLSAGTAKVGGQRPGHPMISGAKTPNLGNPG